MSLRVDDSDGYSAFQLDFLTYTAGIFDLIGVTAGTGITANFFPGIPAAGGDQDFDNDIDASDIAAGGAISGPLELMSGDFVGALGSLQLAVFTFKIIGEGSGVFGFAAFDDPFLDPDEEIGPISAALAAGGSYERAGGISGCSINTTGAFDCSQVAQVDALQSNVVPEPATLTLLGAGLAGAAVRRRLGRSASARR